MPWEILNRKSPEFFVVVEIVKYVPKPIPQILSDLMSDSR